MADAKHTPGPWHVSGEDVGRAQHYLHIGAKSSPMVLASMNEIHTNTPANARLIAAAPELLEALQRAVHWHDQLSSFDLDRMRAAIAKATGNAT